ncbi:MFS transporter [Patescibacteria group bacterium]|nr:MFS transporter [Patescibacteria group bacterium]
MKIPSPKNYFDGEISHGFVSLYTGKTIVMISSGLLGLFLPIFVYNLFGQNFRYLVFFHVAGYFLYALILFFGVKFLNKFGFRRALKTSVFLGAAYYTIFYFVDQGNIIKLLPLIFIVLTLYRLFYWVPYHVDFAKFTSKENRGRQISAINITGEVIGIFIPLMGGFVISRFGFDALFVTSVILYLVSGIPYLTIPKTQEKFSWTYSETLKNLFSKKYRKEIIAFAADGAETSFMILVWPIFIFQLLSGNYLKIGIVSTLIIGISIFFQLLIGKILDKTTRKEKILKAGSLLSSAGWIIKIFIENTFQVFAAGAFHNLMRIFSRTPFETLSYEIAADKGHYVDEFTVIREISINMGRVTMLLLAAWLSLYLPIQYLFIMAAIASVALNLLRQENSNISG